MQDKNKFDPELVSFSSPITMTMSYQS